MKPLTRRSVTTGLAAAVTIVPAVGLCSGDSTVPANDPLLQGIRRYRAEIDALNASRGLSDNAADAWVIRADAILRKAVAYPVVTAAGALAVLDLMIDDPLLIQHWRFGKQLRALAKKANLYLSAAMTS